MSEMMHPAFWLAALQIMGINILLSGDNAVVIALAVRALPPKERFWGMVLGAGCAAVLLILFTGVVATLMQLPYLKLAGGLALFWVAIKLVSPQPHDAEDTPEAVEDLWRAVRVVVVANIVMSLDNVIAVAAAAKGNYFLLGLGLAVSIPVVIAGSALFLAIIERFPIVVWGGGALLGWIAGGLLPEDPIIAEHFSEATADTLEIVCGIAGAIIVVLVGLYLVKSRRMRKEPAEAATPVRDNEMNRAVRSVGSAVRIGATACPHDCPSTCALEVELLDERTIGRIHGAKDNDYTAGVICAKVARYAEREHHARRLLHPLRRTGAKGSGQYERISWDDALDLVAEKFLQTEQRYGAESVWPYYYAGTMGLVMRDGINRLRHVKKYSGFHSTICVNPAYAGFAAGVGRIAGVDPREMAKSD